MLKHATISTKILALIAILTLCMIAIFLFHAMQMSKLSEHFTENPEGKTLLTQILTTSKFFSILTIITGGLVGLLIAHRISKKLTTTVEVANQIADGEHDISIETPLTDETGQLLRVMRQISLSIRETEDSLKRQTAELAKTHESLKTEIAERKATEEALWVSQEYADNIINSSLDMIIAVDTERHVIEFNPAAQKTFGYTSEEVLGQHVDILYADINEASSIYNSTVKEGECIQEIFNKRKDGEIFPCLLSASILRDATGNTVGFMGISCDISEQKQAEEALRRSQQYARDIIESSLDMIVAIDLEQKIIEFNKAAQETFGYELDEVMGKQIDFLYANQYEALTVFQTTLTEGQCVREVSNIRKNGGVFPCLFSASILKDVHGKIVGMMGISRDITEQKRTEEKLRQHNHELVLLSQLNELLQVCRSEQETYNVLKSMCKQFFPLASGHLAIMDESRALLNVVNSWGTLESDLSVFGIDDCWALRRGKIHYMGSSDNGPLCSHLHLSPTNGYLCAPVSASGEILGIIHLSFGQHETDQCTGESPGMMESKGMVVTRVAEHYALSLVNLRLRETLKQDSIRDALTGMYNRRYMEGSLERETRRAERHNVPVGIIMIDVDHFKHFNDTHGHEAGDVALRELGLFLRKNTRGEDIACRYGGEEFLLILPEASLENTRQRAEFLREEAQKLKIMYREKQLQVSISVGVAALPNHGSDVKKAVKAADAALYRAKTGGRNQVVVA